MKRLLPKDDKNMVFEFKNLEIIHLLDGNQMNNYNVISNNILNNYMHIYRI